MLTSHFPACRAEVSHALPTGNATAFLEDGELNVSNVDGHVEILTEDNDIVVRVPDSNSHATLNDGREVRFDAADFTGDLVLSGGFLSVRDLTVAGDIRHSSPGPLVTLSNVRVDGDVDVVNHSQVSPSFALSGQVYGSVRIEVAPTEGTYAQSQVSVTGSIGGDVLVRGGSQSDCVYFSDATVHGRGTIQTGSGMDYVQIQQSLVGKRFLVNTASGHDEVRSEDFKTYNRAQFNLGTGQDVLTSTDDGFGARTWIRGGPGADSITVTSPTIWRAETDELDFQLRIRDEAEGSRVVINPTTVAGAAGTAATVANPSDLEKRRAVELANELVNDVGWVGLGFPIRVSRQLLDPTKVVVTYPDKDTKPFVADAGSPEILVDLSTGTAEIIPTG